MRDASGYAAAVRRDSILLCLAFLLAACGGGSSVATTTSIVSFPATSAPSTSTSAPPPEPCDPPPFLPTVLPGGINERPSPSAVPLDTFTLQPGTIVTAWADDAGTPVVVMVRGALPPEQWTAQPEVIEVRGVDAAVGPLSDGVWAVAWYEGPDRCDEYSIIFYPPTDAATAKMVAESVTGVG